MPKIKSLPGQIDSQYDYQYSPTKNFSRIDNNQQIRNSEYLTPIVPIHEVPYNPQFSKSPLASVQMSRKPHLRVADTAPKNIDYNNYDNDYHIEPQQKSSQCDWKKILMWALIALAILALAIGLYFLIDKLLSKRKQVSVPMQSYSPPTSPRNQYYSGVNPIYVNPVPFSGIYTPFATPSTSLTLDPPSQSIPNNNPPSPSSVNSPISYPVSYPNPTSNLSPPPTTLPSSSSNIGTTQPNVVWNTGSDNSVSPIDVYAGKNE